MTTAPSESLAAALKRKEKLLISLGSKWRQRTSNRSLGVENREADSELSRLAFEHGENGDTFATFLARSKPAPPPAPAKTRAEIKVALWEQHSKLGATEKQGFYQLHQAAMDI